MIKSRTWYLRIQVKGFIDMPICAVYGSKYYALQTTKRTALPMRRMTERSAPMLTTKIIIRYSNNMKFNSNVLVHFYEQI